MLSSLQHSRVLLVFCGAVCFSSLCGHECSPFHCIAECIPSSVKPSACWDALLSTVWPRTSRLMLIRAIFYTVELWTPLSSVTHTFLTSFELLYVVHGVPNSFILQSRKPLIFLWIPGAMDCVEYFLVHLEFSANSQLETSWHTNYFWSPAWYTRGRMEYVSELLYYIKQSIKFHFSQSLYILIPICVFQILSKLYPRNCTCRHSTTTAMAVRHCRYPHMSLWSDLADKPSTFPVTARSSAGRIVAYGKSRPHQVLDVIADIQACFL